MDNNVDLIAEGATNTAMHSAIVQAIIFAYMVIGDKNYKDRIIPTLESWQQAPEKVLELAEKKEVPYFDLLKSCHEQGLLPEDYIGLTADVLIDMALQEVGLRGIAYVGALMNHI